MSETFQIKLNWQPQNKAFTYNDYSREYTIATEGKPELTATAAVAYKGSAEHYNPEELLVAALSGCHMLSYLAIAANSKITVLDYQDDADGSLEKQGMAMKFKEVTLRPKITISADSDKDKALSLHEKAHNICFIANSINFAVNIEPEIVVG